MTEPCSTVHMPDHGTREHKRTLHHTEDVECTECHNYSVSVANTGMKYLIDALRCTGVMNSKR